MSSLTQTLKTLLISSALSMLSFHSLSAQAGDANLNNQAALKGISEIYTLYDVRKANPNVMLSYLKGIESNYNNLLKEKVKPHLRIIFISSAVQFITTKPADNIEMEYGDTLKGIANQIARLKDIGVKMEAARPRRPISMWTTIPCSQASCRCAPGFYR